jgi:hypothetical protein
MNDKLNVDILISKHAFESLLAEMTKRKCESISELIEALAVELEVNRK